MAAIAGASALSGILGQHNRYKYHPMAPFTYTPDQNDPELLLRRRRALEEGQRDYGRTVDEIGRSGLLGSSAGFGQLNESASRTARGLEDINADTFMKRRLEGLDLYRDESQFNRQRALMGDSYQNQSGLMSLGALGDIGGDLGGYLERYLGGGGGGTSGGGNVHDLYDFLMRGM